MNCKGAFTHTSYNDFEIVAANLLDGGARRVSDRIATCALYSDPPLGRIGMSEAEVRASGRAARVATLPMTRVARARARARTHACERGETAGFVRVLVDAQTARILGAALLGIEADEVVQLLLLAMAADLPVRAHPAGDVDSSDRERTAADLAQRSDAADIDWAAPNACHCGSPPHQPSPR